jgi:hypothetical protein
MLMTLEVSFMSVLFKKIQATCSTVVDHTNHKPKREGSNPANGTQKNETSDP